MLNAKTLNRIIEFSFYGLFFAVPLIFTNNTSELFEFNKLWLTFAFTIVIGCAWFIKMAVTGEFRIQRTPLDIPIIVFFAALIISTIFSWDRHVSLWGYYSRFNGGLFSMASYIFLYYAFVSNLTNTKLVFRNIAVSLVAGTVVALWGLPAHFGYDPTCKLFRGTLDVSCWTQDFQPKVRIFSTMGQPDWLGAYLAILLPIIVAFGMQLNPFKKDRRETIKFALLVAVFILFYVDILFTRSRSSVLAVVISVAVMFGLLYLGKLRRPKEILFAWKKDKSNQILLSFVALFIVTSFVVGVPFSKLDKFSLPGLIQIVKKTPTPQTTAPTFASELGGTDSGKIRLYVWEGAVKTFLSNPLFGTGLETYAFAYYKYKPAGQNLTSEWNFLYNKAHNEFLNYLATTGIVGLISYISMIGLFLFTFKVLYLNKRYKLFTRVLYTRFYKTFARVELSKESYDKALEPLPIALVSAYIGILITNFFGFSVVITNIYLFIIPAFFFVLVGALNENFELKLSFPKSSYASGAAGLGILAVSLFLLYKIFNIWVADTQFALGRNLDEVGQYQQAYTILSSAVVKYPEPVYRDEFSINQAVLASLFASQGTTESAQIVSGLENQAVQISDSLTSQYPKNIVYWKSRVRIFYTLAQTNPNYLPKALEAIQSAAPLAPNDASISYNLGVLYGQTGETQKAVKELERTVSLRPDYQDARYALGIFYRELAVDQAGNVKDPGLNNKAIEQMQYILTKITPNDSRAKDAITAWK